jgi:hypothetical protein
MSNQKLMGLWDQMWRPVIRIVSDVLLKEAHFQRVLGRAAMENMRSYKK